MTEPIASAPEAEAVIVSVVVAMEPVPENPTTTLLIRAEVPVTVRLLPTATLPLASLTMLLTALDGWRTLMDLRVEMAASY